MFDFQYKNDCQGVAFGEECIKSAEHVNIWRYLVQVSLTG